MLDLSETRMNIQSTFEGKNPEKFQTSANPFEDFDVIVTFLWFHCISLILLIFNFLTF